MAGGVAPADFAEAFRAAIAEAAAHAVGLQDDRGLSHRLRHRLGAAERCGRGGGRDRGWAAQGTAAPRLADPVLEAFVVHVAVGTGLPLQVHVGFGDRDLDLHRTNPMLLLPLLRRADVQRAPVTLLHCYPYHREAGYLAQAFDNVYFDVGLGVNYLGAQSRQLIAESLEIAPFASSCTPPTRSGCPSCTWWARSCGGAAWPRRSAAGCARANGARTTPAACCG